MRKFTLLATMCVAVFSYAQTVTTYAGKVNGDPTNNYESTSNVDADDTYFSYPEGLCFDPGGRMFVSERNKIRMVYASKVHVRSGQLGGPTFSEGYKNATSTTAKFRVPAGMVCNSDGDIFICDAQNNAIRKLTKFTNFSNPQVASTFAGAPPVSDQGAPGSADGTGTNARFNEPRGITIDTAGYLYVADYLNFTIRKISPTGVVSTLAGSAGDEGFTDASSGANSRFGGPWGIAMYDDNTVVVTDPWNTNIRMVNIHTGASSTVAGPTTGSDAQHLDGTLTAARFKKPTGIVVVAGIIYVADQNIIRAIDIPNNSVTTFCGDKSSFGTTDGNGTSATFTEISDLTTDGMGNLYVTENSGVIASHIIRKIVIDELAPVADFSASVRNVVVDAPTNLTDISTGATVQSRTWTITPNTYTITSGDLSTEVVQLKFNTTGFYTVKLDITNEYGSDSKEVESYFNVSTTGSVTAFNANDKVILYPNPAADQLQLKIDPVFAISQTAMQVYNSQGMLIYSGEMKRELNTGQLSSGVYYLTLTSGDLKAVKRFVVNH